MLISPVLHGASDVMVFQVVRKARVEGQLLQHRIDLSKVVQDLLFAFSWIGFSVSSPRHWIIG